MASVKLIPNGYTHTGSYNFTVDTSNASRRISNAYNDADNTSSSARLTLASNRNSTRQSTMYLEFDKSALSNIPAGATIGTITANVRYYVNNTTYVSALSIQLHADTTAKGNAVTTRTTSSAKYSITPGSWTLSELQNIRLYISATHNASTSSAYLYLYGADVTINYTVPVYHDVTASSEVSGVTVAPASQSILEGNDAELTFTGDISNALVTDNGVDVTSQLVLQPSGDTVTKNPNTCTENTFTTSSSYPASNGCANTSSTSYARFTLATTQHYAIYSFDTSEIPANATIQSVTCSVKAYVTNTSANINVKTVQLYAGTTAKGAAYTLPTSNSTFNISDVGTWTASEIRNVRLRFDGRTSSGTSYYIRFYGANLTVVYDMGGVIHTYTITEIVTDHAVVVAAAFIMPFRVKQGSSWATPRKVLVKDGGTWKEAKKILVKQNGSWN